MLSEGSSGAAVEALQRQLILLGFLSADADGAFGPATAAAVRDAQRRLLLEPDGIVGPRTHAALQTAAARQPPAPTSFFRSLHREALERAERGEVTLEKLPYLDRGLAASPFHTEPPRYAERLAAGLSAEPLTPYPDAAGRFRPYPALGEVPPILEGHQGRGGLEFLSEAVSQACLCVGRFAADQPLRVRWYGRRALVDNVQFWSATKHLAALRLVDQANRRSPGTPIAATRVQSGDGGASEPFAPLFTAMVSYERGVAASNAIGLMLKQLRNPGEPDGQTWLRALSGNPELTLNGGYGVPPLLAEAELIGPAGLLVEHRPLTRTRNLVSAYDLVRSLTLLGWHHQLAPEARLAGARWTSLATLVEGLGHDTARYVEEALERLGLLEAVSEPVVLSKLGYGAETGDPQIDAFTYVAFASFRDLRTSPARQRSFALALRVPTAPGLSRALQDDARLANEVTEVVRRVFAEELS
jgi:hypothetical protein